MRELSLFCDESGSEGGGSRYYILALVLHDQSVRLDVPLTQYRQALADKGLPDIPMHMSPLMNGHDAYQRLSMPQRKSLLMSFLTMYRHLPISYWTFVYRLSVKETPADGLRVRMRRDLVAFLFDHLEYFQEYETVKVYYDNGQSTVTQSLHAALEYALARDAVLFRLASQEDYLLSQVADFICTIELTAQKYRDGVTTRTDDKVFGTWRSFKTNFLHVVARKRLKDGSPSA